MKEKREEKAAQCARAVLAARSPLGVVVERMVVASMLQRVDLFDRHRKGGDKR